MLYILDKNFSPQLSASAGDFLHMMFFKGTPHCLTILGFTSPLQLYFFSLISAAIFFHMAARVLFGIARQNVLSPLVVLPCSCVLCLLLPLFLFSPLPSSSPSGVVFYQSYPIQISCSSASRQLDDVLSESFLVPQLFHPQAELTKQ